MAVTTETGVLLEKRTRDWVEDYAAVLKAIGALQEHGFGLRFNLPKIRVWVSGVWRRRAVR